MASVFILNSSITNMSFTLMPLLFALLFSAFSAFAVYHGIRHIFQCRRMFRDDLRARGTVTAIRSEPRQRKGKTWMERIAVISFETAFKEKREVHHSDNKLDIGVQLDIWYHETDPSVFTLGGKYFYWELFSLFGIAFCFGFPGWTLLVHLIRQYLYSL
jgi:hypothetical protein